MAVVTRSGGGSTWRGFLWGLIVAAILAPVVGFFVAPVALNHKTTLPFEAQLARLAKNRGVPDEVRGRPNPVANDAAAVAEGRRLYSISCVACHGSNGQGNGPIGRNLYPPPANLASPEVRALTDGELFWFVHNGISFAGMPSYGVTTETATATYNETQVWQIVAQIRAIQNAPPSQPGQPGGAAAPSPAASPPAGANPAVTATPSP